MHLFIKLRCLINSEMTKKFCLFQTDNRNKIVDTLYMLCLTTRKSWNKLKYNVYSEHRHKNICSRAIHTAKNDKQL